MSATAKVYLDPLHDMDTCDCGNPKRITHSRCDRCRKAASYTKRIETIRANDRERKKVRLQTFIRVIPITQLHREVAEREIVNRLGLDTAPLPDTAWFRFTETEDPRLTINVTSRPQVANSLTEMGVPVDKAKASPEVEEWIINRHYRMSVGLRDLALAEESKRQSERGLK